MASHDQGQDSATSAADVNQRRVSPSLRYHDPSSTAGLAMDPSMSVPFTAAPTFDNTNLETAPAGVDSYNYSANYFSGAPSAQNLVPPNDQTFPPTVNASNIAPSQSFEASFVNQLEQSSSGLRPMQPDENFSGLLNPNPSDFDFTAYQNQVIDPQMHQNPQSMNHAVNPADLSVANFSASTQPSSQEPQHSSAGPISPQGSTQGTYYTPQHSRNTSLDPSIAAYLSTQSNPDWQSVMNNSAFQGHRRTPSEVSEVSSANHSPYWSHNEFDGVENSTSPSLAPQNDPTLYDNSLGIESFTLSEQQQQQQQQQGLSPLHSPYISPQLAPQQGTEMVPNASYLTGNGNSQFPAAPTDMYGMFTDEAMNAAQFGMPLDMGQASQMAPPSINVEFAPPSRNSSFGPSKPAANFDSLSPPALRSRMRSKSDPYTHPAARPRSPSTPSSLMPQAPSSQQSLSPAGSTGQQSRSNPSSRDTSPSRANRRLSTSSIENRNYILDLADPQRPAPGDSKRVQKHPATFQCTLCPKRFTRAYNLRSHLRTHTDERPFVCTVCGKAFARQHDRKRHEGLHSGEKKFVCRGELSRGGQWGCGRRFARADALGRHFRSEAGRICIKPLLDEESQERERVRADQQQQQQQQPAGHLQSIPQPLVMPSLLGMDAQSSGNFVLPAALLAQYPALQTLQWDQIPAAADDPSDIGGRSSFDASSGGEFGFDDDESGISSVSGMSGSYGANQGNMFGGNNSDQMLGVNSGDPGYVDQEWSG